MVLSLQDPLVQSYIVYAAILAVKLLLFSLLTALKRSEKKVYANTEDAAMLGGKVTLSDPDIERLRRAHLNDLENIPAFWILAALYVTTNPAAAWATLLFRIYTVGRMLHTFVYAILPLPQPSRAIAYFVPYLIMWYMGFQVIHPKWHYLFRSLFMTQKWRLKSRLGMSGDETYECLDSQK